MNNNYSYNYIVINYNNDSSLASILDNQRINYETYCTNINVPTDGIYDPLFPQRLYTHYNLWINLYQEKHNDYWIILEDSIFYIDFEKINELTNWIRTNSLSFDFINLSCEFMCNNSGNKIYINNDFYLVKKMFNISLNGYIINRSFIDIFINIVRNNSNNLYIPPPLLINQYEFYNIKYLTTNTNLIKYTNYNYSFAKIVRNYFNYFISGKNRKEMIIFLSVVIILLLLINYFLIKSSILFLLCVYILILINF